MILPALPGPARDSLIRKRMIYSPEHGIVAFTVLRFGDFMRRAIGPPYRSAIAHRVHRSAQMGA
jgi:hypothetical protein